MTKPLFIFIESNTSGTGVLFAEESMRQGFQPVILAKNPALYGTKFPSSIRFETVDTSSLDAILMSIQQLEGAVVAVFSSSDYFVGMAAQVAHSLGLPSPDPLAIELCREKLKQRQAMAAAGLRMPVSKLVTQFDDIEPAYAEAGPQVVIKPQTGSGSYGVRYSDSLSETIEWAARLLKQAINERGQSLGGVLVESYLSGPEFSVEVFDGKALVVTQKYLSPMPFFVEVGHDMPAEISKQDESVLKRCAEHAVVTLGLTWGPTHVELRHTTAGPVIVEVNPRLAGGFLPKLVKLSTGIDLIQATVSKASGVSARVVQNTHCHAGIRFFTLKQSGQLAAVEHWARIEDEPLLIEAKLYTELGDKKEVHHDFRDRIGHVVACGGDRSHVTEALHKAINIPQFKWLKME